MSHRQPLAALVLAACLAVPASASAQPVELRGTPGHWTINGRAVMDELLGSRLRMIYETRAEKRLYFGTAMGATHGQAVATLAMARDVGVEELMLLSESGRAEDAIRVELVALSSAETDARIPVAHGRERGPADVDLVLGAGGPTASELDAAATAAGASGRVLLRADARATYGTVWQALRDARARGVRALALAVRKPRR